MYGKFFQRLKLPHGMPQTMGVQIPGWLHFRRWRIICSAKLLQCFLLHIKWV